MRRYLEAQLRRDLALHPLWALSRFAARFPEAEAVRLWLVRLAA